MLSAMQLNVFSNRDIVSQIAQCSFDVHLEEILGSCASLGTTLVLFHPLGTLDIEYLVRTIQREKVTMIGCVPTLLLNVWDYFNDHSHLEAKSFFREMKTVVVGGIVKFNVSVSHTVYSVI